MKYYLTTTAKCKNGKKHVVCKSHEYERLKSLAKNINHTTYKVEIYTGNWELVEEV